MKLRDWSLRRWLLVCAVILALPLAAMRLHLKWRVHRAVAALRLAGQPTTFEELNQRQIATAGLPNLTAALTNAVKRLQDASTLGETLRDSLPVVGMATIPPVGSPWDARLVAATKAYLSTNREALQDIQRAIAITNAVWQSRYNSDGLVFQGIIAAKQAASQLSLEAAYLAQGGDVDAALRSVTPIFVIAERVHAEPTLIAQLVRVAIQAISVKRLEYVLGSGAVAEGELMALRDVVRRLLSRQSLAHMYQGELVFLLEPSFYGSQRAYIGIDWMAPDAGTLEDYKQRALVLAYRLSGLADRDILYAIQANSEIAAKATTLNGQMELASQGSAFLPSARGLRFHIWSEQHVAALVGKGAAGGLVGNYSNRFIETFGELMAADAALAVAQYRLRHEGRLPNSLDELVPEFLDAVPIEPQSGRPFDLIVAVDGYGIGRGAPVFSVKFNSPSKGGAP